MTNFPRASGILLHPTSLPGPFGIGDLGSEAFKFVDFLVEAGQTYWQILPLSPTGQGNSPYSAYSAFAGNTLLISPEKLVQDGLLTSIPGVAKSKPNAVEYQRVGKWKTALLAESFENFKAEFRPLLKDEFEYFSKANAWWLDDYALFRALKNLHNQKPWYDWPEGLRLREPTAVGTAKADLASEIDAEKFGQYLFFRQWLAVKNYANEKGIKIIGDIPIFVGLDSSDVWCNQSKFKLDGGGKPTVVAGVPPDYFSKTGQLWGNPIYDWQAMASDDFGWWAARISFTLFTVDVIRLDHFIGFAKNWEIPGGDKTAENGNWVEVPGQHLFSVLKHRLGELPIIAEDLGSMTPDVELLRDSFDFPGMRILQNAFGGDAHNRDLPHNYIQNCVAYTGTHDNDTTAGWYKSASKNVKTHCRKYIDSTGREIHWDMIRELLASVADTVIVPAQDVLGLASDSRMNTPATTSRNWEWRLSEGALTDEVAARLNDLNDTYGRI
ncbi:MAG: 4-alpha-glucanotransferase [Acidobacteriota bacterium]